MGLGLLRNSSKARPPAGRVWKGWRTFSCLGEAGGCRQTARPESDPASLGHQNQRVQQLTDAWSRSGTLRLLTHQGHDPFSTPEIFSTVDMSHLDHQLHHNHVVPPGHLSF